MFRVFVCRGLVARFACVLFVGPTRCVVGMKVSHSESDAPVKCRVMSHRRLARIAIPLCRARIGNPVFTPVKAPSWLAARPRVELRGAESPVRALPENFPQNQVFAVPQSAQRLRWK